jgi:hypothetical protein
VPILLSARSLSLTVEPSGLVRSTMASNCSGDCSSDRALMVALSCCPWLAGTAPNWPAETWTFCACSAVITSVVVMWKFCSLAGFSQIRMAFWVPNSSSSPTPSSRLTISWTLETM